MTPPAAPKPLALTPDGTVTPGVATEPPAGAGPPLVAAGPPRVPVASRLLLSIPDAADLVSLGRRSLEGLIDRKVVPSVKVGARRLVPREGLEEWIAAGCPDDLPRQ